MGVSVPSGTQNSAARRIRRVVLSPPGGREESQDLASRNFCLRGDVEARMTGLEPATSGVTGRCSNQLSYIPKIGATGTRLAADFGDVKGTRRVVAQGWWR